MRVITLTLKSLILCRREVPLGLLPSKLDPFNPKMMSFYKAVPPVNCSSSMEWIKASPDGSVMQISSEAEKLFGPVSCQCTPGQQTCESEENQNRIFSLLKMSPLVLKCRHQQEKFRYANQIL